MPPKSAVITSPFRKEIEDMIIEGKSSRFISNWLKDNDENISHTAINNYRNNGFNIQVEAAKKYNEKQSNKRKNNAVDKQVADIEKIDEIVDNIDSKIVKDLDPKEQIRAVSQLLRTKYQILGVIDDNPKVDVKVDVNNEIPTDPSIRARGRDFIQSIRTGQMESGSTGDGNESG